MNCHTIGEGLHHIHFCISDGSDDCLSNYSVFVTLDVDKSDNEQSFTNKSKKILKPFAKSAEVSR